MDSTTPWWLDPDIRANPFFDWDDPCVRARGRPIGEMRRLAVCNVEEWCPVTKSVLRCSDHGKTYTSWSLNPWGTEWIARAGLRLLGTGWSRCPACDARIAREQDWYAAQRQQRDELRKTDMQLALQAAGIPATWEKRTFAAWKAKLPPQRRAYEVCHRYATQWEAPERAGANLLLLGRPGSGKTHLAVAICLELMTRRRTVRYVTVGDLLLRIRSTYDAERRIETQGAAYSAFTDCDLLVLDEIGVQYATDGERNEIFAVLDKRYQQERGTVLISNLSIDGVTECIGHRVVDRLRESGCELVQLDVPSMRGK